MVAFVACYSKRKQTLRKNFNRYDIDQTGFIGWDVFSKSLMATNDEFNVQVRPPSNERDREWGGRGRIAASVCMRYCVSDVCAWNSINLSRRILTPPTPTRALPPHALPAT